MTLELKKYVFNQRPFHVWSFVDENGDKILLRATDVAEFVGHRNPSRAILKFIPHKHKYSWRQVAMNRTFDLPTDWHPDTIMINEDGIQHLASQAPLENFHQFRDWISSDVLPSIRKEGVYVSPNIDTDQSASVIGMLKNREERLDQIIGAAHRSRPQQQVNGGDEWCQIL